jgi:tight adherence protein C
VREAPAVLVFALLLFGAAAACALRGAAGLATLPRRRVLHGLVEAEGPGAEAAAAEPLNRSLSERVLQPALERIGRILGRFLPDRIAASTDGLLQRAGVRGQARSWLAARALLAAGLGGYAGLIASRAPRAALLVPVLAWLGWMAPTAYLQSRARRRRDRLRDDLPDAMDLLTVCVEAGLGFDQALQRVVARFPGPVAEEFGHVLRDQALGTPRRSAMLAVLDRTDLPELRAFVHAILQAEDLGVRIASVLRVQSESLREQRRQRAEEAALKAPVKMAFPMIFLILPALFLVVLGPAVLDGIRALGARHP